MKIKRIMAFFLMFTLSASALMAGCAKQEEQQTAETPSQSQQATQQAEQNEQAAEPVAGKNLAVVNGIAAVADDNGFSRIDEAAGKETQIDSEPANQVIFNGSTAYYVRRGIEDKSVKIRYDEDTIVDEGDEEVWLRGEVYIFTKESGKSQKLFITNQETAELVYFDSENLYYTDFADENVGYFLGASKDIARSLYKYDLNSGKKTLIADYACRAEAYGSCIFYNAYDGNSSHHPDFVNPGPIHIYDTKTGTDVKADDYGELLYAENDRFYFIHITEEDDGITGGAVKSCKADGTELETVRSIDGEIDSRYGNYVTVTGEDNEVTVINTKNGKEFKHDMYGFSFTEGKLFELTDDFDGKLYYYNDNFEKELYVDLNNYDVKSDSVGYVKKTDAGVYVEKFADDDTSSIRFIKSGN